MEVGVSGKKNLMKKTTAQIALGGVPVRLNVGWVQNVKLRREKMQTLKLKLETIVQVLFMDICLSIDNF